METYTIVRFFRESGKDAEIVKVGLSKEDALRHCNDPSTSTQKYFDGFEKDRRYLQV